LFEDCLAIKRELEDELGVSISLNNLGNVAVEPGNFVAARALLEQSLVIWRDLSTERGIEKYLEALAAVEGNGEARGLGKAGSRVPGTTPDVRRARLGDAAQEDGVHAHDITLSEQQQDAARHRPGGYIPSWRETVWLLPEFGFELLDAENLRLHYAFTLDQWS
jgi:hypothetical protein